MFLKRKGVLGKIFPFIVINNDCNIMRDVMIYINARFLTQDVTGVQRFAEQICMELVELRSDIVLLAPRDIKRATLPASFNVRFIGKKVDITGNK